jgi:hypothetical protein
MRSETAGIWIRNSAGELVRTDSVIRLRCADGVVEAACADGSSVQLAGPGCPRDFHARLLGQIARLRRTLDDRWIVILAADLTPGRAEWASQTTDELESGTAGIAPRDLTGGSGPAGEMRCDGDPGT